jgi:cyclase
MIKITDHVFVETKYLGANVGCVITEQGPVLIDTPMLPEEAHDLRDQLRQMSELDIAYIIYTHQHFDHVMGSAFLTKRTIAYNGAISGIKYLETNLANDITLFFPDLYEEKKEIFDNLDIILPQITFFNELRLYMGDRTLELFFVGGHSSASIVIYVPEDRVVFCGDNVVTGIFPVTANCRFGPWIEMLRRVEEMEVDTIVPGHGDIGGKELARNMRFYFEGMRDRVRSLFNIGATKEEVLQRIDLTDCLPVPPSELLTQQVASDVSRMHDQIEKGFL